MPEILILRASKFANGGSASSGGRSPQCPYWRKRPWNCEEQGYNRGPGDSYGRRREPDRQPGIMVLIDRRSSVSSFRQTFFSPMDQRPVKQQPVFSQQYLESTQAQHSPIFNPILQRSSSLPAGLVPIVPPRRQNGFIEPPSLSSPGIHYHVCIHTNIRNQRSKSWSYSRPHSLS